MNRALNILLVEDDEICVRILQRAFSKMKTGHQVQVAYNGIEAFDLLGQTQTSIPSLILLDVDMPRMNGLEFLKKLRKMPPYASIPVFMLTSNEDSETRKTAYEHNVAGYILKPLLFENYIQALQTLNSYWELMEWGPAR
ncbi:MAG: response regulator [Bacteroidia bacterium]|nr:response regulator [Bacteroidia bacterium]